MPVSAGTAAGGRAADIAARLRIQINTSGNATI